MPIEVIMPKVDMDMASGKIMSWHVADGDTVRKGDPLFDIETDKAAMEIEAPADGILQHTAPEGAEIPIGQPCAWLYARGEMVGAQPAPFPATAEIAPGPEPASEASFSPSLDIIFETAAESARLGPRPVRGPWLQKTVWISRT